MKGMEAFLPQIELEMNMLSEVTQTPDDRPCTSLLVEYETLD